MERNKKTQDRPKHGTRNLGGTRDHYEALHELHQVVVQENTKLCSAADLQLCRPSCDEKQPILLSNCSITEEGCAALVSALRSNPSSHLRELNLNYNKPGDSGVKQLSALLEDPHCKLEKLH
ncbi:hypothetical protein P4O66_004090 [Electrophorus voltai]|uniref:Uncharacterized protein n=1 Tax=Electrophorus voltai TaxID=2609070 RepID=A0AAD9E178_9TELE|nr:hypothetical protein P4O66_004090 [Electrophorus voltai]